MDLGVGDLAADGDRRVLHARYVLSRRLQGCHHRLVFPLAGMEKTNVSCFRLKKLVSPVGRGGEVE